MRVHQPFHARIGFKIFTSIVVTITAAVFISFLYIHTLRTASAASQYSWVDSRDPTVGTLDSKSYYDSFTTIPTATSTNCNTATLDRYDVSLGQTSPYYACWIKGQDVTMSTYAYQNGSSLIGLGAGAVYDVSFPDSLAGNTRYKLISGTNTLVKHSSYYPSSPIGYLSFKKDLRSNLIPIRNTATSHLLSYDYNDSPDFIFENQNGPWKVGPSIAFSNNGKWAVVEVIDVGLVQINLDNFVAKRFSTLSGTSSQSLELSLAISDDGRQIVSAGAGNVQPITFYEVNESCGEILGQQYVDKSNPIAIPCTSKSLPSSTNLALGVPNENVPIRNMKFGVESGELEVMTGMVGNFFTPSYANWRSLFAPGYTPPVQLDYLALGDSYSSGEGDVDKKANGSSYYLPGTEQKGGCHVSERSYPFLLRNMWNISTTKMQSVACSGAQVTLDYTAHPATYLGQGNRLKDLSASARLNSQEKALEDYEPGKLPQLEFVKKYKPKILTIMGGGNDVGFASMLSYCAFGSPNVNPDSSPWKIIEEGFYGLFTCDFAKHNSVTQQLILKAIEDQYIYMRNLLTAIEQDSPETKIYLIGYPSFISPGTALCLNSLELNSDERAAIDYFLKSLNLQLQKAAQDEDASFIDIEGSLNGGRMCEGSEYVSGTKDVNIIDNGPSELFHPNAKGHQQIADIINGKSRDGVISDLPIIDPPNSVGVSTFSGDVKSLRITTDNITSGLPVGFSVPDYTFTPSTKVSVVLHSDPVDLGILTTNTKGGVDTLLAPDVSLPSGFHFLTLTGKSYSGEDITVYQFVTVGLGEARAQENLHVDVLGSEHLKNTTNTQSTEQVGAKSDKSKIQDDKKNEQKDKLDYRDVSLEKNTEDTSASLWRYRLAVIIVIIASVIYIRVYQHGKTKTKQ